MKLSELRKINEGFFLSTSKKGFNIGGGYPGQAAKMKKLDKMLAATKGVVTDKIFDFILTWNPKGGQYDDSFRIFVIDIVHMMDKKIKFVPKGNKFDDKVYYFYSD